MTTSTATLTTLRDRVETALMDTGNLSWDTGTLDEAIRRALGEISAVLGGALITLNGLDGAAATTLEKEDESALVSGAVYYAVFSRAIDRLETPAFNQQTPEQWMNWADEALQRFAKALDLIRRRALQSSANPPALSVGWDESEPTW